MGLRTIIVDDEPLVLSMIQELMSEFNTLEIIKTYTKASEVLQGIQELSPDLVFLDINMPRKNGIELASEIIDINKNIMIVFITSYDKYAIEAFNLNALHYILKPPTTEDINSVIERAISYQLSIDKTADEIINQNDIKIKLFGNSMIISQHGDNIFHWPTAKSEELFALLLAKGQFGIDKWQIIDYLWPDSKNDKAEQLLYSTVYRMKKSLKNYNIPINLTNHLGKYTLGSVDVSCDVYDFEELYTKFKSDSLDFNDLYSKLFSLYNGSFLSEKNYSWSKLVRKNHKAKYSEMYTYLEKYLLNTKDLAKLKDLHAKNT